jgi:hypothetical protein
MFLQVKINRAIWEKRPINLKSCYVTLGSTHFTHWVNMSQPYRAFFRLSGPSCDPFPCFLGQANCPIGQPGPFPSLWAGYAITDNEL